MLSFLRRRRRRALRARAAPPWWNATLLRLPAYRRLDEADRRELCGHVHALLAEKVFEGAGGFVVTDEVKLLVAAQAALLLLHRETEYYSRLRTVVVYPDTYV